MHTDPYDLDRFVDAQETTYPAALQEIKAGRKVTHWMWFIFPQIEGLGHSAAARAYAIRSRDEATAYLAHPLLGPRLIECTRLVNAVQGRSAHDIFASPDDLKFRSSMTLFAETADDPGTFEEALHKYFAGEKDPRTLAFLNA